MAEVEYVEYQPKTIVNTAKRPDHWFWAKHSAYPYIGCRHGCEFCYCRERKYSPYEDPGQFSRVIKVKMNAPDLMREALRKTTHDPIFTGDYQAAEARYTLSRQMLAVCRELRFPVLVLTRSPLVIRDIDILQDINTRSRAVVMFSIISTPDSVHDDIADKMEGAAPKGKSRFLAMERLAKAGITTGACFMPVLPGICDDDGNLSNVVRRTKEHGGTFVLAGGLTLSDQQREHYFAALSRICPELTPSYASMYRQGTYGPPKGYWLPIARAIRNQCEIHGIADRIPRPIIAGEPFEFNKRVVERIVASLYSLELEDASQATQWAYRRAAWAIEDLTEDLLASYLMMGGEAVQQVKGISPEMVYVVTEAMQWVRASREGRIERPGLEPL